MSQHSLDHCTSKNFTTLLGLWIFLRFMPSSLTHVSHGAPKWFASSCSPGLMDSVVDRHDFHRMSRWSRFLQTVLWPSRRIIYSWGKTVNVYCYLTQVSVNCFQFSFLMGIGKNSLTRSTASCQGLEVLLICSSGGTTSSTAAALWSYFLL